MIKDYTNDEIINALTVIRNICKETENCFGCPFYDEGHDNCVIQNKNPVDWLFADEYNVWRAVR